MSTLRGTKTIAVTSLPSRALAALAASAQTREKRPWWPGQ